MRPRRVFTWHVHGSYLYYLVHSHQEFYLPVRPQRGDGYWGRWPIYPPNVFEVPVEQVRDQQFDCLLFQSRQNYLEDQYQILSPEQRALPRVYLEHDPPREHPTDTRHLVDDPNVLLVHCTHFNNLMWDSGRTPTVVIEHGVVEPEGVNYSGELERGLVVVNNLRSRGRRLGADLYLAAREQVPLDLVGMGSEQVPGGLGEVPYAQLATFSARYRFFFNPIRYTSLGLAVLEAMMVGLPIVGLATTEMVSAIENGVSGYVSTDAAKVVAAMRALLRDPAEARRLGEGARRVARERYNIARFARDWDRVFEWVTGVGPAPLDQAPSLALSGGGGTP